MSEPSFISSASAPHRAFTTTPQRPTSSRRPRRTRTCAITMEEPFPIGAKVRVSQSLIMYHYPKKKNAPVDVKGFEGFIKKNLSFQDGVEMSATAPYMVTFPDHPPTKGTRFSAHFSEDEIELLELPPQDEEEEKKDDKKLEKSVPAKDGVEKPLGAV